MQYSAVSGLSAGSLGCVCGVVWGEWKGKEEGGLDSILGVAVGWGEIAFALGQLLLEGGGGFGGFFGACFIAGWCCVVFGVGFLHLCFLGGMAPFVYFGEWCWGAEVWFRDGEAELALDTR